MIVKDLLALPLARDFKLLAGAQGLTNQINSVNIMDNPHALDWLFAGELIVTSGYFFSQNYQEQAKYFTGFKELNIPAICLKPHLFMKGVSPELINLCDQLNLPLIEIPYGLAFSKILKTVMNQLSPDLDSEKQFALDIHSKFFEAALNGNGIQHIAQELTTTINNPVLVTQSNWQVLTHAGFSDDLLKTLINQEGSYVFPTQALDNLPTATAELKHPFYRKLLFQDEAILCCIMPIYFNNLNYGYIIVYLTDRPLSNMDDIVLETCAMSIALEVVHRTEKERISNRIQRDFLSHLLSEKVKTINELKEFNVAFNYDLNYVTLIISVDFAVKETASLVERKQQEEQLMMALLTATRKYIENNFLSMYVFKQGNHLIGLLGQDNQEQSQSQQKNSLTKLIDYLAIQTLQHVSLTTVVGSQQPVLQLSQSYREALNLLNVVDLSQTGIHFLNDFYLEAFLSEQIANEAAQQFSSRLLTPVIDYDSANQTELLKTLDSYLTNHLNIAAASRELFIHRNTLLYRITQLQNLLNIDLQNSDDVLSLQLALRLLTINA